MEIIYHKNFNKAYAKLPKKLMLKVDAAIDIFLCNPFDKSLKNHALKGLLLEKRSISVTGDLRILFEEYDNYFIVLLLDVGTHSHVYGM